MTSISEDGAPGEVTRREFVAQLGAVGASWALALSLAVDADQQPHGHDPAQPARLRYLSSADAREVEAIAERIIPSDDGPGAREAGVLRFIDRALATFSRDQQPVFRDGLADVARRARELVPGATRFSSLSPPQQDAILRAIENTDFFRSMRFATIAGMLCLPSYGGNKGLVGWRAIGLEDAATYAPPFGYYDRPANLRKMLRGDA